MNRGELDQVILAILKKQIIQAILMILISLSFVFLYFGGCTQRDTRIFTNKTGLKYQVGTKVVYGWDNKKIKEISKSGQYFLCTDYICRVWHNADFIEDVAQDRSEK